MNVVQFHPTDAKGGGSKLAYQIHDRMRRLHDVESRLFVDTKYRDDDSVHELGRLPGEDYLTAGIERLLSLDGLGSPSSFRIQSTVRDDVDLIHLHNVHGGYFNMLNVRLFPSSVPILWTTHDMWPVTGNCINSHGCTRFESTCGQCPELDSYPGLSFDTTRFLLALKRRLFDRESITYAVPSEWMGRMIERSRFGDRPIHHVPNGIDIDRFEPMDTDAARQEFDLSPDHDVILFVAHHVGDEKKGLQDLVTALRDRPDLGDVTVLVVGKGSIPPGLSPSGYDVRMPGFVSPERMPLAFNAATITAIPSYGESFCLTATESMACETPVVAYDVGGLGEQVTSEVGWTAPLGDLEEFTANLETAIEQPGLRREKGRRARQRVTDRYNIENTVESYYDLYRELTGSD